MADQTTPGADGPETGPNIDILMLSPLPPGPTNAFKDTAALNRMADLLPRRIPIDRRTSDANAVGRLSVKVFEGTGLDLSEPNPGAAGREFEIPVGPADKS